MRKFSRFSSFASTNTSPSEPLKRIVALIFLSFFICGIIGVRLFYLQIIKYDYYEQKAIKEHYRESRQEARRGEIFIKDYASNENVRVATNITLDTLFIDQKNVTNEKLLADKIAPLIFNLEEAKKQDAGRIADEQKKAKTPEEAAKIKPLTDTELEQKFHDDILEKISRKIPAEVTLGEDIDQNTLQEINKLHLAGIKVSGSGLIAYPAQIPNIKNLADTLSTYLEIPPTTIETDLQGLNRYVILKKKIPPEVSAEIRKIIEDDNLAVEKKQIPKKIFGGLGLESNYYRSYPEGNLAANILGFVGQDGIGKYGIESNYNTDLQGKNGLFKSQRDSVGRQITVGDVVINPAVDGKNIILTLDRSIQNKVETILAHYVNLFKADNGQAIVMDPKTGRIMAMANYPTFDPNHFSEVANKKVDIHLNEDQIKNLKPSKDDPDVFTYYPENPVEGPVMAVFKSQNADGTTSYQRYKNYAGPEAYQNKCVSDAYEPGSVFKVITMASALEDGDVKPTTTVFNPEVLELDFNKGTKLYDAKIHDVSPKCRGQANMTWILQNSCNTGISQVALKMGQTLFQSYTIKFGFNELSEIEFDNEHSGKIPPLPWTDGELANHAFGQGILTTPIQMVTAYTAIANKGILMQPHIVDSIEQPDGKKKTVEPTILGRVVSEKTAAIITSMLKNNVENGDSYQQTIKMDQYFVGAKTGTAQTYKGNRALSGLGTTKNTVVGFAPMDNPKFVILVKIDRPRNGAYKEWADGTSGRAFRDIAEYLFDYFNIPPDK